MKDEHQATTEGDLLGAYDISVEETEPAKPAQPPGPRLWDLPNGQQGRVLERPSRHQQQNKPGNDGLGHDDA